MSEPTTTMRDAIEAAFKDADEPLPTSNDQPSDDQDLVLEAQIDVPGEVTESEGAQDLQALAEGQQQVDDKEVQQQPRDEEGKFKAKDEGIQPGPKSGPKGERAPASWKPDIREHWGALPEGVRAEINRREVEVQRTLQESAEARKNYDAVMKTVAPYEAFIKAEGSNPIQAIDNLMSTAARLRTGTAPELAQLVAGIVNQFGIGRFGNQFIEQLDSALAGQAPKPQQTSEIEQVLNQKLAPVQQMLTQFQQAQAQQQHMAQQQAVNEVEQFISQAEFGNDVREDMADILEVAQRRGINMSLQDAYKKAVMMNDNVRSVLTQRVQAQKAQSQTQAAHRARSAAVSVSGAAPMGGVQVPATDVRSAIEAAIVSTSR